MDSGPSGSSTPSGRRTDWLLRFSPMMLGAPLLLLILLVALVTGSSSTWLCVVALAGGWLIFALTAARTFVRVRRSRAERGTLPPETRARLRRTWLIVAGGYLSVVLAGVVAGLVTNSWIWGVAVGVAIVVSALFLTMLVVLVISIRADRKAVHDAGPAGDVSGSGSRR